ncbi:unnamed protein product [Fusarium venenatum]|uniref:Uncharacterized protein n=1 Tax=Fusarium venenatum TaxID=56646 RepID=A0A2L2TKM1_9HYPO|nr:uncharacterized protein FVRRES_13658 [Fusarium venenatum]CEI41610.1 unnamed protein product [Fusarium venenatum]
MSQPRRALFLKFLSCLENDRSGPRTAGEIVILRCRAFEQGGVPSDMKMFVETFISDCGRTIDGRHCGAHGFIQGH